MFIIKLVILISTNQLKTLINLKKYDTFVLLNENYDIVLDDIFNYCVKFDKLYTINKTTKQFQIYDKYLNPIITNKLYSQNCNEIPMIHDYGIVILKNENNQYGLIDSNGNVLLDFEYDYIDSKYIKQIFHVDIFQQVKTVQV